MPGAPDRLPLFVVRDVVVDEPPERGEITEWIEDDVLAISKLLLQPEDVRVNEEAASPEELRELQATLALLGTLPQVAPRRTFILSPEQVAPAPARRGRRRFAWVWPTRWATALAAVCFAVSLGVGQGTPPTAVAVAPTPTAITALAAPATATTPAFPPITVFGTPDFVLPVATAVPLPKLAPPPPAATATDWRPVQLILGALTALGGFFGFMLPPFLRRRGVAAA